MKKILFISTLLIFTLFLTSCGKINIESKVTADGSSSFVADIVVEHESLKNNNIDINDVINKVGASFYQLDKIDSTIETKNIDGIDYDIVTINIPSSKNDVISLKDNKIIFHLQLLDKIIPNVLNNNDNDLTFLKKLGIEINLNINCPKKIISTNYGIVDGRQLKVDLLECKEDVVIEIGNDYSLLISIIAGTIVVGFAIFCFKKTKLFQDTKHN